MNKFFTKVAAFSACLAMAIGVGVAVASNSKEATPVQATETSYTITFKTGSGDGTKGSTSTAMSSYTSSSYVTGNATTATNAYYAGSSGLKLGTSSGSGSLAFGLATSGQVTATKVTVNAKRYNSSKAATIKLGDLATQNLTSSFADYEFALTGALTSISITTSKYAWVASVSVYYNASTPLTGITLGGAASSNAMSIGSSDLTAKTVSVTLNPLGATDQKVNIAHQSGTSGLFKVSSSATCTSGSGSFTVTGKGNTSGSETFRISGNTETSVYVDLVVTALDDSVTYWAVSFDSDGGASIADMNVEDGEKFVFPSPGTKTHYSFDGWSSDGGNTLYDAGDESPTVNNDIEYTAYWTEDAKYTVTYVHGDHGTGNNYVVNNVYGGSYTLATFATAGFTADSGYSFKKWSVGGVEYAEGASITISGATTVTAVYEEVTTYTIVTDASTLKDGTTFVLVGYVSSTYYVSNGLNSGHVLLTSKTAATTISNGVESGSTLVSTEAQVLTLEGSTGAFKIKYGDSYLKFTGTSNGNDSFDTEANASTFSASMSGSYILFTCTSSTGNGRVWRMNTGSKDMRNYATSSGVGDVYMFANIPASNELDSVTTSGQTTSFIAGNNFSYGGTLTAHYTLEEAATVTPTSYKYGASGIDPTTAGTAITTSTALTKAEHDGKYIYVIYTEDDITKYCSYQITVSYAAVTSVEIDTHATEIGLNETYEYTSVHVTVNSSYADQGYEWIVHANTVGDDYTFNESGLTSKDTVGTITLWCRSTADNSKYDELIVTVTGDPTAEFTPASVSGYVGKGTSVAFTYGNIDDTSKISVSSNNASVTVGAITASAGEGSVAITFVSAGSATLSISYNGGSALDTVGVTVSADSVTALTWSAPTIKVYSGATTTVSDASSWNVHYTMASGDEGDLSYGEYTLKLGGSSITLPHTWDASEDGKVLSIEYGGFASPTTSTVNVTQTLQAVMAPVEGEPTTSTLTFTEKYSDGGATSDGGEEWTDTSDGTESAFDSTKGIHYGTGSAAVQYINLTSSDFTTGNITSVVVNASTASGVSATVEVTVGGEAFGGDPQSLSSSATNYTFTGSAAADEIIVTITKPSSATKALYCKSIVVTCAESSSTQNIANVAGHEAAQKAVVAFAKAMNTAFDKTENCTDGVADAWDTASSAYSSNIADNASLSADEKAYAKNLIKYASAQYTDDTDNDYSYCLERAMKTYEVCIQKHGQTAFMSNVRPVGANVHVSPLGDLSKNSSTMIIVVVTSLVAVAAIGGYFLLRKRKED